MSSLSRCHSNIYRVASFALTLTLIFISCFIAGSLQKNKFIQAVNAASVGGCPLFPANNIWNRDISTLPVHRNSANFVASMGPTGHLHGSFAAGLWNGKPIGIPYIVVTGSQPYVPVSFDLANGSDPGPYPIPPNAPVQGGPQSTGDRHTIVVDSGTCRLYELYAAYPQSDGSWKAGSGAMWNLNSNALRPSTWTSADAAGLPLLPGLVRYDEIASGVINHALSLIANNTQRAFIWPARHIASSSTNPNLPPMGLRLRLKSTVDISSYSRTNQVILTALKHYGMFVTDDGGGWDIYGAPDNRWNNSDLQALSAIPGSDFEAIDESGLQMSANSGEAAATPTTASPIPYSPTPTSTHIQSITIALLPEPAESLNRRINATGHISPVRGGSISMLPLVLGGVTALMAIIGGASGFLLVRRSRRRF